MSTESELDQIFQELKNSYDTDDYANSLTLVEKILSINNQDTDAQYIRVILHLKLDNYEKALTCINLLSAKSIKELGLTYEHLYILYSLNKVEEFEKIWNRDILNNSEFNNSLKFRVLRAQLAYKQEDYYKAIELYKVILTQVDQEDSSYTELYTNYLASIASYKFNTPKHDWKNIPSDYELSNNSSYSTSYEANYNLATNLIASNNKDAKIKDLLQKALNISKDSMNEMEYTKEEQDVELAPILLQLAYSYHKNGDFEEAKEIYENLISLNQVKTSFHPIALNNANCLKLQKLTNTQLTDSFQEISKLYSEYKSIYLKSSKNNLQNYQVESIKFNNALVALLIENYGRAQSLAEQLIKTTSESIDSKLLLCNILLIKNGVQKAQHILKEFVENNPQDPTGYMALSQLSLIKLRYQNSIQYLEQFRSNVIDNKKSYYLPGVVGTLIWLLVNSNQFEKAEELLAELQSSDNPYKDEYNKYIPDQLAQIKLKTGNPEDSVKMYKTLLEKDNNQTSSVAGLVNALSHIDIESAQQYASQLPQISELRPRIPDSIGSEWDNDQDSSSLQSSKKRKNHRKNPVAKSQKTGAKIDLERWLPLKDRSYYKPKNKSKKIRGTQGGSHSRVFDSNHEEEKVFGVQSKSQQQAQVTETAASEEASKPKTSSNKSKNKKKNKGKGTKF
ncbi:TPR-like protein [Conidiobolus coronatus NRRL 28638]|uniref:Signal recognition particle subunit SRP72 n=1 Tax=Conidiobolus coronatus (strain ATCC 28846 / CBS 209.66 / NRRL 28638) TaxID=796925 RepID=A0A137PD17_CONC2|nr:TPR-like protein [Conidiobolus coronatus NRRL 28638]|eukprot:KXN72899.1 TPR-like protein [Conidiobolus coronatus NRRL 28638]